MEPMWPNAKSQPRKVFFSHIYAPFRLNRNQSRCDTVSARISTLAFTKILRLFISVKGQPHDYNDTFSIYWREGRTEIISIYFMVSLKLATTIWPIKNIFKKKQTKIDFFVRFVSIIPGWNSELTETPRLFQIW